jgi:hypothetical protein
MLLKFKDWIKRYWKAEVLSTSFAVLLPMIIGNFTDNLHLLAVGGVIGDNIGYYGYFFFHEHKSLGWFKRIKLMISEFGIGEAFDSFLLRPLLLYLSLSFFEDKRIAVVVGKICADITFYLPTVVCYELFVKKESVNEITDKR